MQQLKNKVKAGFFFYRQLWGINAALSAAFALLELVQGAVWFVPELFLISFVSYAYLLSLFIYELRYKKLYYLYFNLGIGKTFLFLFGALVNFALAAVLGGIWEVIKQSWK